ncbi:MAG TPA: glycine--tRNA ligase subunit beta [Candidatus Deferrimicrobiaceae bacterium]|jgi:glycyl-tRNA synthetase beta chain
MERDYLLEIGCEEIPAGFVGPALRNGSQLLAEALRKARLSFDKIEIYGTPRRLAFLVRSLKESQDSSEETVLGPPKSVAFDADGKPSKAAAGFARSQGVDIETLRLFPTERGEYLGIVKSEAAHPTVEILPKVVAEFIPSIPFRKSMRWADLDVRFVRPVQWIVSLYGEETIPFGFGNVVAGNASFGHRFLSSGPILLHSPADYVSSLEAASVLVELEDRKRLIREGLLEIEKQVGIRWVVDEPLLETVGNIVEFPVVMMGRFEQKYLSLPREILVTTMRNNQKYFVFEDASGKLFPGFAFVSNTKVIDPDVVVAGNARVLRARLSDAEFYYSDDLKIPLFDRAQALKSVLFQKDMGTYWEKVERMADVAGYVASWACPGKDADCRRAAILSKADLTTGVVKEFPELQGIMGSHYASRSGETVEIALSIQEHYLPKGQADELPSTEIGAVVALSDKIDMICGCFGVGLIPTGTADPYALRRQTLGALAILESRDLRIPLAGLVDRSLEALSGKLKSPASEVRQKVLEFFSGRLFNLWTAKGVPADLAEAVLAAGLTDVVDLKAKLDALVVFRADPAFEPLAEVFKRAINITKNFEGSTPVSPDLFEHEEERVLFSAVESVSSRVREAAAEGRYGDALGQMASLQSVVAAFFEKVLVMAKEDQVKNNRLALLKNMSGLFSSVADFSKVASNKAG